MESVLALINDFGFLHLKLGQAAMILIGLGLLYLAIVKKFEPLLLVPIGLGGILANLPDANLAINAVEAAIYSGKEEVLQALAAILGTTDVAFDSLKHAYEMANPTQKMQLQLLAEQYNYSDGMLYTFYSVAIASGVGPLVIFMGVGAMTDFGPLLANPKTLLLGAAAQFGIFATVLGALGLSQLGVMDFSVAQAAAIGIIGGA
ncbi:MAG TPA: oxaloacetate decarboxylase subunit beta, partial [Vibrio sp.]|nr:oxaloacetate decarboxylase subunit beta [Vibrio sp.]